jgi:hypothetical protein
MPAHRLAGVFWLAVADGVIDCAARRGQHHRQAAAAYAVADGGSVESSGQSQAPIIAVVP